MLTEQDPIVENLPVESNTQSLDMLRSLGIIRGSVASYRSLSLACSSCYEHSVKPRRIVMGDFPWFWVVSPADAERLILAGYELAD